MARNIGADGSTVYRAVITHTNRVGQQWTDHEGPYAKLGAARARVTFWRNYWARNNGTATGHVEQAHTVWAPVGEEPRPDLATVAAAYRQAAELISTADELRDYTDDHMGDIHEAAAFLRRRADEIHPAPQEQP
ncbi:hypothetical protein [Streptomyces sp. NPDC059515]|uniref:hypothetical protein n=1 Tax=Streptomyces sp. NPDC059515 TaxID=3346854 RepID=UPI0036CB8C8B